MTSSRLKAIDDEQYNIRMELTIPQAKMYRLGIEIASLVDIYSDEEQRTEIASKLKQEHKIYKDICSNLLKKYKMLTLEKHNIQ